jgi:hypothetical protein
MKFLTKKNVQILISIILIALLLYWIDLGQMKESLRQANLFYIIIAFFITIANRILMPVKWNLLLKAKKINLSVFESTKIYFISSFLGIYLPPTVGSDTIRAYYVHKKDYPLVDVISSIFIERFIGFAALLMIGFCGCIILVIFFSGIDFNFRRFLYLVILLGGVTITGFFLSLNKLFSQIFTRLLGRLNNICILTNISKSIEKFYNSYLEYREKKAVLLIFFFLTCIEVLLPILRGYFIAIALNTNVSLLYFFSFVPIILLLIRLPISIDGFGIHEGGFIYFLSILGVSKAVGFNIGLLNHLIFLIAILPGGLFYIFDKSPKRKVIRDGKILKNQA